MLKVEDVFRSLSLGHLSNLAMATENPGEGQIREKDQNKLIGYMNDCLTALYSRFCLSEKSVIISQYDHITNYHLDYRFAQTNENRPAANVAYILDLPGEPFMDDAINILKVEDDRGCILPLNQNDDSRSVFTPYPTILNIPNPVQDTPVHVTYQAKHARLELGVTSSEIIIPSVLEDALKYYVAAKVFTAMNSQENMAVGQNHLSMYEAICSGVEAKSHADISKVNHGGKFYERGFR